MVDQCKVCKGQFSNSPDSVVLCKHNEGLVHLGCCINGCSWDKKPCENAVGVYEKLDS